MPRATSVYPDREGKSPNSSKPTQPERRGASRRTVIETAKEKVSVKELAERLGTDLRSSGKDLRGRCPVHGGENPTSFAVDPEAGVWFCYSCLRGGDVVELARIAWGYDKREVAMAAADLLHEFGHEIPPRPATWFRKKERQRPIRESLDQVRVGHLRRRIFRLFEPMIQNVEDLQERAEEARYVWDEITPLAVEMCESRKDQIK